MITDEAYLVACPSCGAWANEPCKLLNEPVWGAVHLTRSKLGKMHRSRDQWREVPKAEQLPH